MLAREGPGDYKDAWTRTPTQECKEEDICKESPLPKLGTSDLTYSLTFAFDLKKGQQQKVHAHSWSDFWIVDLDPQTCTNSYRATFLREAYPTKKLKESYANRPVFYVQEDAVANVKILAKGSGRAKPVLNVGGSNSEASSVIITDGKLVQVSGKCKSSVKALAEDVISINRHKKYRSCLYKVSMVGGATRDERVRGRDVCNGPDGSVFNECDGYHSSIRVAGSSVVRFHNTLILNRGSRCGSSELQKILSGDICILGLACVS